MMWLLTACSLAVADDLNLDVEDARAASQFQAIMENNEFSQQISQRPSASTGAKHATIQGEVQVSLERFTEVHDRARQAPPTLSGPLVVLGSSSYSGALVGEVLELELELTATLRGEGLWKTVPLAGEEAVIAAASVDGRPIPMARQSGYHVWVTDEVGEKTLRVSLLVPASGPRGSLEFSLPIAQTPMTTFSADFPIEGLEPRLRRAIQSERSEIPGGTRLSAALEPTSRLHLVGFRAMEDDEARAARVFAETLSLLSLNEGLQEQFVVIRYNILYAGQRRFDVQIPPGMEVVSAEGPGAFRYQVDVLSGGVTMLRGETAYPIRDTYELSLRLARRSDATIVDVELPRCVGVEREVGWLGVEVAGNLKLEEVSRSGAAAVDVRQLPVELVSSAIQPILKAYRYTEPSADLTLSALALPEQEPASGAVDRVAADTVISPEGTALTEMHITLRNRLRHSLRLALPEGAEVRSAFLDDQPVRPSRDASGAVLLPLRRSGDSSFSLKVIIEQQLNVPGLLSRDQLSLPALDLPSSQVYWTVYAPGDRIYSGLRGDIAAQQWMGTSNWMRPPMQDGEAQAAGFSAGLSGSADGAMPVRISIPKSGTQRSYRRYWVEADAPVTVQWWSSARWLPIPVQLLGVLAGLFALLSGRGQPPVRRAVAVVAGAGMLFASVQASTAMMLLVGALMIRGWKADLHGQVIRRVQEWWAKPWPPVERSFGVWASAVIRFGLAILLSVLTLTAALQILAVLRHPLG
ncbi:MAG: hypothetical protein AAFV53_33695 [Myxococcota bacterium]